MRNFDRIVLVVLALGIWALVLKPTELTAHWHTHDGEYAKEDHDHSISCNISGQAYGSDGTIWNWDGVDISCSVY